MDTAGDTQALRALTRHFCNHRDLKPSTLHCLLAHCNMAQQISGPCCPIREARDAAIFPHIKWRRRCVVGNLSRSTRVTRTIEGYGFSKQPIGRHMSQPVAMREGHEYRNSEKGRPGGCSQDRQRARAGR